MLKTNTENKNRASKMSLRPLDFTQIDGILYKENVTQKTNNLAELTIWKNLLFSVHYIDD